MRAILVASAALFAAACDDSQAMALLDHPQILAVRAEPPAVAAGGEAHIDVLASDSTGAVFVVDQGMVSAPPEIPAGQPVAMPIEVSLTIEGETLLASKSLVVGVQADNPAVAKLGVPDEVPPDSETALRVAAAGGTGELSYARYTSLGTLEGYRSREATLVAGDEAGDGLVLVVVRDAQGGVDWLSAPVTCR